MELIAPLPENCIATWSYRLFRVVVQAPISPAYTEEKKREASRLALHGAYKSENFLPPVEDVLDIFTFLDDHFELATRDEEDHGDPIQNALCVLIPTPGPVMKEALKHFDLTKSSFVHGIHRAFQGHKPLQLCKAALFFLPHIAESWFNAPHPLMKPDEMKSFCMDWVTAIDKIEDTDNIREPALSSLQYDQLPSLASPHRRQ